jgi:hypothetical protein
MLKQASIPISQSGWVYVADLLDGRLWDGERTKCISKWLSLLSSYQRYGRSFRFSVWNWLAFRGEEWAWCMSHYDESPHNLQEIFKCFCQCQYQFVFPGPFFIFMSLWQISESTNLEWEEGCFSQSYWSWSMVTGLATFEPAVMRSTMVGSMWCSKLLTPWRHRERRWLRPTFPKAPCPIELWTPAGSIP